MEANLSTPEGRLNLKCWGWLQTQRADGLLLLPQSQEKQDLLTTRLATLIKLTIEEEQPR